MFFIGFMAGMMFGLGVMVAAALHWRGKHQPRKVG